MNFLPLFPGERALKPMRRNQPFFFFYDRVAQGICTFANAFCKATLPHGGIRTALHMTADIQTEHSRIAEPVVPSEALGEGFTVRTARTMGLLGLCGAQVQQKVCGIRSLRIQVSGLRAWSGSASRCLKGISGVRVLGRPFQIALVASLGFASTTERAFAIAGSFGTVAFGSCYVETMGGTVTGVALKTPSYLWAGGSLYLNSLPLSLESITIQAIATCLATTDENVDLKQEGADGEIANEVYMGFAFELGTAAGGLNAGWHEYMIGTGSLIPDTTAPVISSVGVPSAGTYTVGQDMTFTLNWSENATVTGTPRLALTIGSSTQYASYVSGTGTTALVFKYTVQSGDEDADGIAVDSLDLNSGTIKDAALNDATLTLNSVGSSFGVLVNAVVDTPASEFAAKADLIRQTVKDDAARGLTSALSANQAMVQDAKGRFVAGDTQDVAMNVDGSLTANPVSLSSMGTFFGQSTNGNGTRQLVFGSFDVQRDDTTGASTATFNGKIAWERSVSDTTLLGYFIGGDLARSNIAGSFTGDQDHLGVTAGGYAVHEMAKQLYLDGFVSVGAGRNNLTMDDGVLALDSDYTTRSATFGMSVSGVIGPQGYEIWPELALTVGRTWIDTVAFTGTAYGATDSTLSLDASMVTLANLTFRPEFRIPLDGSEVSKSLRLITLAPRLICQQTTTTTTTQTCGGGAELGLQTHSADGMTTGTAQILSDWIDGQTRTSGQLSVEMRF
jgi:hypothetical protein